MKKKLYSILSFVFIAFLVAGCYVNEFDDIDENTEQNGESENTELDVEKEVEQIQQRVDFFQSEITPLAQKCDSASQMIDYIDQIKEMPQVKDAWVENDAFCITDESGLLHVWDYQDTEIINDEELKEINQILQTISTRTFKTRALESKRACLVLGETNDNWEVYRNTMKALFIYCGINDITSLESQTFTLDALLSQDFLDYDFYYIRTHGNYYNNQHWLMTNTKELDSSLTPLKERSKGNTFQSEFRNLIASGLAINYNHYKKSDNYYMVSEKFFSDFVFKKEGTEQRTFTRSKPIIFNAACLTMTNNQNMGNIFVKNGHAGAYLGFSSAQCHGRFSGIHFFRLLLNNHYTFNGALLALSNLTCCYWTQNISKFYPVLDYDHYIDEETGRSKLKYYYETFLDEDLKCVKSIDDDYTPSTPEAIDMGGKVKWATCNIGAGSALELGDSLRWGEIKPWYTWIADTYLKYKRHDEFGHYDNDYEYNYPSTDISGNKDKDAATAYLGEGWRLPTKEDFEELLYSGDNEVEKNPFTSPNYLKITNKNNGNQIILPYPDFEWSFNSFVCHYWTSDIYTSIDENGNNEKEAWAMLPVGIPPFYDTLMSDCPGYYAGYVRPVYEGQ